MSEIAMLASVKLEIETAEGDTPLVETNIFQKRLLPRELRILEERKEKKKKYPYLAEYLLGS